MPAAAVSPLLPAAGAVALTPTVAPALPSSSLPVTTPCTAGIDVSQDALDVAVRPGGTPRRVPNDATGHAALVEHLTALSPTVVALEATGGYERGVVAALVAARVPVAVLNPRQVRDFARATGQLAKTDRLDAGVLAYYAAVLHPEPRPILDAAQHELAPWWAAARICWRCALPSSIGCVPSRPP